MTSPFPGMDPYLEGSIWPDLHHRLSTKITNLLVPQIRPKYVARIARYVVEDEAPENEIGIMYPDVEVFARDNDLLREPAVSYGNPNFTPISFSLKTIQPVEISIPVIEIKDIEGNRLITAIEILSPVNKRQPGLKTYRQKRQKLKKKGVHFIEIDLLRRGNRTIEHPKTKSCSYLVALSRAKQSQTDFWLLDLLDKLPTVPVPLLEGDKDAMIDLQKALTACYEEAAYDLSINYQQTPPPPALTDSQRDWLSRNVS
ncbi:MAG: DUF4058 family protein [Bacteroidota bacterium]